MVPKKLLPEIVALCRHGRIPKKLPAFNKSSQKLEVIQPTLGENSPTESVDEINPY